MSLNMFQRPYFMSAESIKKASDIARKYYPVTDSTRVSVMNQPLSPEEKEQLYKELDKLDQAYVSLGGDPQSRTYTIEEHEGFGFIYISERDELFVKPSNV